MASRITSGNTVQDATSTTIDLPAFNLQAHDALWVFVKHEGANTTRTPSILGATSSQTIQTGAAVSHSGGEPHGQTFVIADAAADSAMVLRVTFGATRAFSRIGGIQFRPGAGTVFTFTATTNESTNQGTSSTPDAGSLTTPGSAVLVAGFGEFDVGTWTFTGWNKTIDPGNSFMMGDRIEPSSGTFDPLAGHNPSMRWVALSGWLDEVASGGGGGAARKRPGIRYGGMMGQGSIYR